MILLLSEKKGLQEPTYFFYRLSKFSIETSLHSIIEKNYNYKSIGVNHKTSRHKMTK